MLITNRKTLFIFLFSSLTWGQGLFENAGTGTATNDRSGVDFNGFIRSTAYVNRLDKPDSTQLQSGYGEIALLLTVDPSDWASAFTEVRFRGGNEYGGEFMEYDFAEAYINLYPGKFDLRIGKQIVVWGRADGFNPTNNITPMNTTVRSPDSDDIRGANFLVRSHYNFSPALRLEGIWAPTYSPTVLAFEMADLPANITIGEGIYPDARLKNSLWAGRLSLEFPAFDGSISYARGYNPMPGIKLESLDIATQIMTISPAAYRQQVIGVDFSTAVGSWGLRGEGAWRIPDQIHDGLRNYYIPYEDFYYVVGLDRMWGDFNLIAQYVGRFVPEFEKLVIPSDPLQQLYPQLENYNRLFTYQTDQTRHALSFRPSYSMFYETLSLELFGMYDLTTGELMLIPQVVYKPADALSITFGGNWYRGDDGTLNDLISDNFNAVYGEVRLAF